MNQNIWPFATWLAVTAAMLLAANWAKEPYRQALRVGAAAMAISMGVIYAAVGAILVVTL